MTDELLDLVDSSDTVIGTVYRSEVYTTGATNFRVVNAFIINEHGQLWIPRRTATKRLFPLCLDASMGGHVMSGETYDDACARELHEELGIRAQDHDLIHLGSLRPDIHGVSAFMRVYAIFSNTVPDYNTTDFCEYYWLAPSALHERVQAGDRCKGDLPLIVRHLL